MRAQLRAVGSHSLRAACAIVILTGSLTAQVVVSGSVSDPETFQPLRGVFVSLTDARGKIVKGTLTDTAGRYYLRAPVIADMRLRAEFIGRKSYVTELKLSSDSSFAVNIRLESLPLHLTAIEAIAAPRCSEPRGDAKFGAVIWEETKKALRVTSWYKDKLDLFSATYKRVLDSHGIQILDEHVERTWGRRSPFAAISSDTLATVGFARATTADTVAFYGVDAAVLLSDAFVSGHCFWADARTSADTLVALRFRPVRNDGNVDIAGTFWLNQQTKELRLVEYSYVNTDAFAGHPATGQTWFRRMPDGTWIIDRWHIRLPLLRRGLNGHIVRTAFGESGGHVIDVRRPNEPSSTDGMLSRVTGFVYDSVSATHLSDAQVYFSGTTFRTLSDKHGRFDLEGIPRGHYELAFYHPMLDSLPPQAIKRPIFLDKSSISVDLAIPSVHAVRSGACGKDSGLVWGFIHADGVRVSNAAVKAIYTLQSGRTIAQETRADASGYFLFCGLPYGVDVTLQPGADSVRTVRLGPRGITRSDLETQIELDEGLEGATRPPGTTGRMGNNR